MAGGFGGGAEVLVGVLGAGGEEGAEGAAVGKVGGARAQLGFEGGAGERGRRQQALDQLGVGERLAQRVPRNSLGESGR